MILPVALAVIAATVAISASAGTMANAGVRGLCACCGVDSDGAGDAAGAFAWIVNLVTDDGLVFSTPYRETK